jgi:FKBP-type peptidyl-prolyl cis-trans isomerase
MRTLLFSFLGLLLLAQIACKSKGVKTENGYMLTNHTNNEGPKAQLGETVLVSVNTWVGDSLMGSTDRDFGGPREYPLPTKEQLEQFKAQQRVPALIDAALMMAEGDSATLIEEIDSTKQKFLPPALKDEKEIRYEIKVVDIITEADKTKAADKAKNMFTTVKSKMETVAKDYAAGALKDKINATESGLKYIIEEKGSGEALKAGNMVKVHYYGVLTNGTMFDNSFERGEAMGFPLAKGQMIPGFDEGVQLLNKGGKAIFFIPPALAYGETGTPGGPIPPNAEIIFYVEVQ